jgi:uncharacterized protein YegP (UPF0339 family)
VGDDVVPRPSQEASPSPAQPLNRPASRASSIHDLLNPAGSDEVDRKNFTKLHTASLTPPSSFEAAGEQSRSSFESTTSSGEEAAATDSSPNDQSSAKKRDHDEMMGGKKGTTSAKSPSPSAALPKQPLARTSSYVRLAMTVDGAVKVRTTAEPTPSPEKPRARAPQAQQKVKPPLDRSKSAINGVEIFRDNSPAPALRANGGGFGRSRDARTWEFYCDSSKDALSTQADAESAGSAISAINLIRSNSFKSRQRPLSPSLSKINGRAPPLRESKPKLSRAKSSLGRLQGLDEEYVSVNGKPQNRPGHSRWPSDESDKENWAPGTRDSENALRRTQPTGSLRPILQENEDMTFPDADSSQKRRVGGGPNRASPSSEKPKGEEIACIEGLLSLSQGIWTKS